MMTRAELKTVRLTLRPLGHSDEAAQVNVPDDFTVSKWLAVVPFPYGVADF